MEIEKLASRIYGLSAALTGGDADLAALLTGRVLKKMPPALSSITPHGLLCEAGKHLAAETARLPPGADDRSKNNFDAWSFPGRLLLSLQVLHTLSRDQRLLFLLRNQWGLGVEDLALCWNVPAEEMFVRLKQTQKNWQFQLEFVLRRKRKML